MGKIIAITSGKGGTGKTSFTAGVSVALARRRKRVLCIDMDVGLKNLDLSLGMSDRVMMDFSDVIFQRCELMDAVVPHPLCSDLYLLTAPLYHNDYLTAESVIPLVESAARLFDFVLIDAPAGVGRGFKMATIAASRGIVVTTNDASALRDARRAVEELHQVRNINLVMNRIEIKLMRKIGATIDDAMDRVGLQLLGIVPEDSRVMVYANQGKVVLPEGRYGAGKAYDNIASRLLGYYVPLMNIR